MTGREVSGDMVELVARAMWEDAELRKDCKDWLREARFQAALKEAMDFEPTDADLAAHRERRKPRRISVPTADGGEEWIPF